MAVSVPRWSMLRILCLVPPFLMMSTLLIHMWSNSVAKQSPPSRKTCLDHILLKSAAWQSPLTRGICLDHIWSKSAVRQSPPTRGTFQTTFVQSPQWDKVLRQGAHFGPHLVEVRCVTKSFNRGHILDHIWSKSAVRQSPPRRGTFWTTFGQSPLHDKVHQQGAQFGPHLAKVRCVTKFSNEEHNLDHIWSKSTVRQNPPTRGIIFLPHLANVRCVTSSSDDQSWASFSGHIWPKSAVWHVFRWRAFFLFVPNLANTNCLICNSHQSLLIFLNAYSMSNTANTTYMASFPKRPDITGAPNQVFIWQLLGLFDWRHQSQYHIRYRDHQPGISMHPIPLRPPDPFQSGRQTHCLYWKLVQQNGRVQFDQDQHYVHSSLSLYQG